MAQLAPIKFQVTRIFLVVSPLSVGRFSKILDVSLSTFQARNDGEIGIFLACPVKKPQSFKHQEVKSRTRPIAISCAHATL